jgi:MFS family permease
MFVIYALLGLAGGVMYARLPPDETQRTQEPRAPLGPSRAVVYKMAALFSIDAFAGGFAVQSLLALWLFSKFGLSLTAAGLFFFWSAVLAAFSFPVAAWLARRVGLVNTMVFTHIPSSVCLILAAIAPTMELALASLLVRAALSQMDVPTRSSYVMAVVTPAERPAAASVTSVPRSLAAAASPAMAGALFAAGADFYRVGQQMGEMAVRMFEGEDPAKMPINYSLPKTYGVNLTVAAGLRDIWTIPAELLAKSTTVVDATGVHKK